MLEVALEERVPPAIDPSKSDSFILVRLSCPYHRNGMNFNYYIIRGQKQYSYSNILSKGESILTIDCQPNAQNLFNRIKETCQDVEFKNNYVRLLRINEEQFISDIHDINDNKYTIRIHPKSKKQILEEKTMIDLKSICRTMGYVGYSKYTDKSSLSKFMIEKGY
jgi:hypothetical protein